MLTNPTPIVTDPVPSKTYDKLHVYTLSAIQPTVDSGSITVELLPATSDGQIASGDQVQRMTAPLNPEIMVAVPELKAAFDAVIAAIPATQAYLASLTSEQEVVEPETVEPETVEPETIEQEETINE